MAKVVLSVGLTAWPLETSSPEAFWRYVDRAEALGLDSIWLSDRVVTPAGARGFLLDPLAALSAVAGRTTRLKLGTSVYVLPLRNPVIAAKELATLDFLSNGRMLLAVGVGDEDERAYQACGVPKGERGGRLDEAIPLLRRLWQEPRVTHQGRYFKLEEVAIDPKPIGTMPIWLGGRSDAAYRRIGRLCDGWLPSATTPEEVADGVQRIQAFAAEAGREIEEDHYGAVLGFFADSTRAGALRHAQPYLLNRRPDVPAEQFAALGSRAECLETIERYVEAGSSKFVLRPAGPPEAVLDQLDVVADLQREFA